MKKTTLNGILVISTISLLIISISSINVRAQDNPPTQEQLFNGHNFDENYWDINVFNNSKWDSEDIDPMVSWLNNTWNVKWMKEDNFEMGMLAFMNKTMWNNSREVTFTTPAQMWWQHVQIAGSEILIASMHSSWFGFEDDNGNGYLDIGEEVSPYFFMGADTDQVRNTGINSHPKTYTTPLERTTSGSMVTYKWGYNYTDIIFYVPQIYRGIGAPYFFWGFNYSRVDTYVSGSHHIGNMTHFYYEYTLDIDTASGVATLYQNYDMGEIGAMVYRDNIGDPWAPASIGDHWVPENFSICFGTYSFIWAAQDYAITTPTGTIDRLAHEYGLQEVVTTLGGVPAFDFKFSQKPNYDVYNRSDSTPHTYDVSYQTWNVSDGEFIDVVSGMIHLVGEFGRLLVGYVINQTNHFTYGIPMEEALNATDPENLAAFYITCYPEYGMHQGGKLVHDPVFVAYFTASKMAIPSFSIELFPIMISVGIITILITSKKIKVKSKL